MILGSEFRVLFFKNVMLVRASRSGEPFLCESRIFQRRMERNLYNSQHSPALSLPAVVSGFYIGEAKMLALLQPYFNIINAKVSSVTIIITRFR